MIESSTNTNMSGLVVWLTVVFLIVSLIAIFATSLFSPKIEADAFTDYYDLGITTELAPDFDYWNVDTGTGAPASNVFFNTGWLFDTLGFKEPTSLVEEFITCTYPDLYDNAIADSYANGIADYKYIKISNSYSSSFHVESMAYSMANPTYAQFYYWYAFDYPRPSSMTPEINWYDSSSAYIATSALYTPTATCTPLKWYVMDMSVSGSAIPSGSSKYSISIDIPPNCTMYISSLYLGAYNRGNGEHVSTKSDIYNILNASTYIDYHEHDALHWYTLYKAKSDALDLAVNGATLEGTLSAITSTPINALKDLLSYEINVLGIDVKALIIFIFSLAVVGVVIKILIGRSS